MSDKLSIVTVVYNNSIGLKKTIQSIKNQNYKNIEHIVVDGGSIDGTVDLIKDNEDWIDFWISENDDGIYDAMNKGIDHCTGEWICFMNSGDCFCDNNVVKQISKYFNQGYDYLYGRHVGTIGQQKIYYKVPKLNIGNIVLPNHQSMFIRSDVMRKNKYDLRYKLWGDMDLKFKLYKMGSGKYVDIMVVDFDMSGFSYDYSMNTSYKKIKDAYLLLKLGRVGVLGYLEFVLKNITKTYFVNTFKKDALYGVLKKYKQV